MSHFHVTDDLECVAVTAEGGKRLTRAEKRQARDNLVANARRKAALAAAGKLATSAANMMSATGTEDLAREMQDLAVKILERRDAITQEEDQ